MRTLAGTVVDAFWDELTDEGLSDYFTPPLPAYPDEGIYAMRTRTAGDGASFMFDDEFWRVFHSFPLRVCHVQWLSSRQTDGESDARVFELRFAVTSIERAD